jgi:hypothetical protein
MLTRNLRAISSSAVERTLLLEAGLPPEDLRCGAVNALGILDARRKGGLAAHSPLG